MVSPPFCPYDGCANHRNPPKDRWWRAYGHYETRSFGSVPRFQCMHCGKTFSLQTFSIDFYAKRRVDYRRLESLNASSMSLRALGRYLGCSCASVQNRLDRLGRQALACHARLRPRASRHEDVAIDGFVSFDRSQYFPNNLTISITSSSRFVLAFTHATLRRSGCMRELQKKRRDEVYRDVHFEPRALERSFTELLDELERDRSPRPFLPLVVITDEKLEYRRAFVRHRLFLAQDEDHRVVHQRVSSRLPRTVHTPLFPSNYLDRELRKDQAAHRRETTCFTRSAANGLSRLACYVNWHNYAKRYSLKSAVREDMTHGEMAGIGRGELTWERARMFTARAFVSLLALDPLESRIWRKAIPTPGKGKPSYLPMYALA